MVTFYFGFNLKGFSFANDAILINENGDMKTGPRGIAYTMNEIELNGAEGTETESFRVELELRSHYMAENNLATVMCLWNRKHKRMAVLSQWNNFFIIQEIEDYYFLKSPKIGIPVNTDERYSVLIVSDRDSGMTVYLNGERAGSSPHLRLGTSGSLYNRVCLGSLPCGKNSWNGEVYSFSVSSRTNDPGNSGNRDGFEGKWKSIPFSFRSGHEESVEKEPDTGPVIYIPELFHIPDKKILALPRLNRIGTYSFLWDFIFNIAGFLPFGFCLAACQKKTSGFHGSRPFVITLFAGLGVSLAIELVQVFIPTRSSQISDLLLNTAGACTGAFLYFKYHAFCGWNRTRSC